MPGTARRRMISSMVRSAFCANAGARQETAAVTEASHTRIGRYPIPLVLNPNSFAALPPRIAILSLSEIGVAIT